MDVPGNNLSEDVLRTASAWFARVTNGDGAAEDQANLNSWLAANPTHRDAYAFVSETSALAAEMARPMVSRPSVRRAYKPRGPLTWASAASFFAILAVGLVWSTDLTATHYRTAVGELRTVTLEDGSTVALNAASRIAVRYSSGARDIELSEGEALFTVAKNRERPFRVHAGNRTIQAVGTAFDVGRHGAAVDVAVSEGTVAVFAPGIAGGDPSSSPSGDAIALSEGHAVAYIADQPLNQPHNIAADQIGSWRSGFLTYDHTPLAQVVTDLNRQFPGTITIDSPQLASMDVTLTLKLHDRDTTIHTLEKLLPVRAVSQGPNQTILLQQAR